jgi:hypothetical protein
MVWWNPLTWFSRSAQVILKNSNTNVLKSALRNYINAVNALPNKNNAHIYGLMMQKANGTNASYKNRIINGIAKVVVASRPALGQAAAAVAIGAPEGPAAAAVNAATAKINAASGAFVKNQYNTAANNVQAAINKAKNTTNLLSKQAAINKAKIALKAYKSLMNSVLPPMMTQNLRIRHPPSRYINFNKQISNINVIKPENTGLVVRTNVPNPMTVKKFLNNHKNDNVNKAARIMAGQFKNTDLSTLALTNLSNKQQEILNKAIQFKRNNNATRAARAAAKLNQDVAGIFSSNLEQAPVAPNLGAFVNKSKAAAELLYKQAYGGVGGIGLKSGQWTVNKSVQNLTNTNNKMARFIGLNRAIVNANLNARSNKGQANRAKKVLNAIIQKQTAVPGN